MSAICVIVPVYKVEGYLRRCVDSILAQTFSNFTLILVDDGSPDHCGEICEEYAAQDRRVTVLHRENGGLSAARNTGIDFALNHLDSPWLAFVDSDDWVSPHYLARLYGAVRETGCKLSACGFQRTAGEPLPEGEPGPVLVMPFDDYYCGEQHGGVTAVAWNKLYHRSCFEKGLRYPEGKLHEDEFTTYRAVYEAERVAVIDAPLYAYFQNDAGIIRSPWNPRRLHLFEALEQQLAFAQGKGLTRLGKNAAKQYLYAAYDQLGAVKNQPDHRKYRRILRKKLRRGLKLCRSWGVFPRVGDVSWAYEEAYPCKLFWWLYGKLGRGDGK